MRWLFLVLIMLNALYYVWHRQEAPLRVKEIAPLSVRQGAQKTIHLLTEPATGLGDGRR
jgi:hypothetical protein